MPAIAPRLMSQLIAEGVDLNVMLGFLEDLNAGKFNDQPSVKAESVPSLPHPSIIDRRGKTEYVLSAEEAFDCFKKLELPFTPASLVPITEGKYRFTKDDLRKIGVYLYPKTAYGVLNGGVASSYVDIKKNQSLDAEAFESYRQLFDMLAKECQGKPKGITPAYINPDGSVGFSYLFLKLRMLLEHKRLYRNVTGFSSCGVLPAFQMTSVHTDAAIQEAFREYIMHPGLKAISDSLGCPALEMFTETQAMMAAITHSSEGLPRRIFDHAYGKDATGLAIPGGHGQNFKILEPIYRKMYAQGIRYVWIGNIDNMGYTVDPVSLAIFALSGKDAAFEESYRTAMDVKGGILVSDCEGRLTCADIGPAISYQDVLAFESEGKHVLFNCGIGLFDLEKLIAMLPEITYRLPLRITDQDKDAGRYAQAEQITWEVIGLLRNPLFFAVEKKRRFVAAKMLMETIMTSIPPNESAASGAGAVSHELHKGLIDLLSTEYGLTLKNGKWRLQD